jgi:adenine deaminase
MSSSILRSALVSTISGVFVLSVVATVTATAQSSPAPTDLVIKNAMVMTASYGTIQHGSVWLHNGKIAGVVQP